MAAESLHTGIANALNQYWAGNAARGKSELNELLAAHPEMANSYVLMDIVRSYAYEMLEKSDEKSEISYKFYISFFDNLPDLLSDSLKHLRKTETTEWLVALAFFEYKQGNLKKTGEYISTAVKQTPSKLFNAGILSLYMEAHLGLGGVQVYRNLKPSSILHFITSKRRSILIKNYLRANPLVKIHFGCGDNILPGWLNSDLSVLNRGGVVYIDTTEKLPFEDNSVDYIYSEHMIEHIRYPEAMKFLKECLRVLKKGGICRIATPNLEFLIDLYTNPTDKYAGYIKWSITTWVGGELESKALVLNDFLHNWGHQCVYDFETLSQMILKIGFRNVQKYEVGTSASSHLTDVEKHGSHIPAEFNLQETLVLEATK